MCLFVNRGQGSGYVTFIPPETKAFPPAFPEKQLLEGSTLHCSGTDPGQKEPFKSCLSGEKCLSCSMARWKALLVFLAGCEQWEKQVRNKSVPGFSSKMSSWRRRFQNKFKIPPSTTCFISLLGTCNKDKVSSRSGNWSDWWDPLLPSLLHHCLFTRNETVSTPYLGLGAAFPHPLADTNYVWMGVKTEILEAQMTLTENLRGGEGISVWNYLIFPLSEQC